MGHPWAKRFKMQKTIKLIIEFNSSIKTIPKDGGGGVLYYII